MEDPPLRRPGRDSLILLAARAGYAARGLVYLGVGALALMAAADWLPSAEGSIGAMAPLAAAPLGRVWIALIATGLGCFAFWRALQSVFDADREGRSAKALVKRAGQALSGLVYGALSYSLLELLDELEDLPQVDEERAEAHAEFLLGLPLGEVWLLAAGLGVALTGLLNLIHGVSGGFRSDIECSARLKRFAGPIGRAGYIARGASFAAVGYLMARAAIRDEAHEVTGLGGALQAMERQPAGSELLTAVALGLVAFGCFGLIEARYRTLREPHLG